MQQAIRMFLLVWNLLQAGIKYCNRITVFMFHANTWMWNENGSWFGLRNYRLIESIIIQYRFVVSSFQLIFDGNICVHAAAHTCIFVKSNWRIIYLNTFIV